MPPADTRRSTCNPQRISAPSSWACCSSPTIARSASLGFLATAVAEAAPSRIAQRKQSTAVSPPPSTTTRLPFTSGIWFDSPSARRLTAPNSTMAGNTPGKSPPGTDRPTAQPAPVATNTASFCRRIDSKSSSLPNVVAITSFTPSSFKSALRRATTSRESLNGGMP